mgnify:CR=1 FL=1
MVWVVDVEPCHFGSNQRWSFDDQGSLRSEDSGNCLGAFRPNFQHYYKFELEQRSDDEAQLFIFPDGFWDEDASPAIVSTIGPTADSTGPSRFCQVGSV